MISPPMCAKKPPPAKRSKPAINIIKTTPRTPVAAPIMPYTAPEAPTPQLREFMLGAPVRKNPARSAPTKVRFPATPVRKNDAIQRVSVTCSSRINPKISRNRTLLAMWMMPACRKIDVTMVQG